MIGEGSDPRLRKLKGPPCHGQDEDMTGKSRNLEQQALRYKPVFGSTVKVFPY